MICMSQDKFNEMYRVASRQAILDNDTTQIGHNYDASNAINTAKRLESEVRALQYSCCGNITDISNVNNRLNSVEESRDDLTNSVHSLGDEQALMADQISAIIARLNALEKENKMLKEARANDAKKHSEYAKKINSLEAHKRSMEDRIASLEIQLVARTGLPQGPTTIGDKFDNSENIKLLGIEKSPIVCI